MPQVLGGACAAVTSALAASFLGVGGTLAGAFVGSLVATIGAAVYAESLARAGKRLRVVRPAGQPSGGAPTSTERPEVTMIPGRKHDGDTLVFVSRRKPAARRWLRLTVGLACALGIALAAITVLELVIGHPVSSSTRSGTTIGDTVGSAGAEPANPVLPPLPTSTTARSTTPKASTSTATASATEEPSPSSTSRQLGATAGTGASTPTATSPARESSTLEQPTG